MHFIFMFYTHWVVLLSRGGISDTRNQKPGHLGLDIMYFVNAYLVSKRFIGNTIITICFSSIMIVHTCDYLYNHCMYV